MIRRISVESAHYRPILGSCKYYDSLSATTDLQETLHGAVMVIRPMNPVVKDDAELLKTSLLEAVKTHLGRVVLDLSNTPFVDSRCLEAMLDVTEVMANTGQSLKLIGSNEIIRDVLEFTDLTTRFEHFSDVNTAVRSYL